MRQVIIAGHGGPEQLQVRESPDPAPGAGQVRIRVRASGVNFADVLARQGLYPDAPKPPCVVGYEVSGVVDAAGPQADPAWIGREVFAMTRFGGYADTVLVADGQVVGKPASLSHEQAAALPLNYLTAWQLLVVMGSLSRDETVLIHNAGGGVGLAAVDLAAHIGARILGTASPAKHPFLRERGVHEVIDYRNGDWTREVNRLTDGHGVELVIDPLGGAHWRKSWSVLRSTGRLGMFGVSTASETKAGGRFRLLKIGLGMPWFNPVMLMNQNRSAFGVNVGHLWGETAKVGGWMQALLDGVARVGCVRMSTAPLLWRTQVPPMSTSSNAATSARSCSPPDQIVAGAQLIVASPSSVMLVAWNQPPRPRSGPRQASRTHCSPRSDRRPSSDPAIHVAPAFPMLGFGRPSRVGSGPAGASQADCPALRARAGTGRDVESSQLLGRMLHGDSQWPLQSFLSAVSDGWTQEDQPKGAPQ